MMHFHYRWGERWAEGHEEANHVEDHNEGPADEGSSKSPAGGIVYLE